MLSLPADHRGLRERFAAEGYVPLPGLVPLDRLPLLRREIRRLESMAAHQDPATPPRPMTTLGGRIIAEESELIPRVYHDPALIGLVRGISELDAVTVADPLERHVVDILHPHGDAHGAHHHAHPLALVVFTEAPGSARDGGLLQYGPAGGAPPASDELARRAHHRPGDGYLLRSDTTAHRVTGLRRPGLRRVALNFAYTTPDRQTAAR
ncbi:hypothetical protein ACFY7H_01780 [Streptomyces sp. NPDC012794]|uniref:HalD/BesD family halogenase n=1 Tax=Streptomyces sp. NPDC012794 TaxID=3364850 RepID=UPI0036A00916